MSKTDQEAIPMSREQFIEWVESLNFCWCGKPALALFRLRSLLQVHSGTSGNLSLDDIKAIIPDEGTKYLLLYWLDAQNLTEHGGSVGGAWLTSLGARVLGYLGSLDDEEMGNLANSL